MTADAPARPGTTTDPVRFFFVESDSLITLYNEWLEKSIGYFDRKLKIYRSDATTKILEAVWTGIRRRYAR